MKMNALERAVEIVGGQSALAKKLGPPVKQAHIWNWLNRDKCVPAERALPIEEATGGKVTRYDLRPDVFGPPPSKGAAA